jgi:hypothetical protein
VPATSNTYFRKAGRNLAKRRKRLRWIKSLKEQLVGVELGIKYGNWAGFRVGRIVRARWDRKTKQIVKLVIRLFGRDPGEIRGFNGRILSLEDRQMFAKLGSLAQGIIQGSRTFPLDQYVKVMLAAIQARKAGAPAPEPCEAVQIIPPTFQDAKPVRATKKSPAPLPANKLPRPKPPPVKHAKKEKKSRASIKRRESQEAKAAVFDAEYFGV